MFRRRPLHAVFFDAGNTLLFASLDRTLVPLTERGLDVSREQLYAAERAAKRQLDRDQAGAGSVDHSYWSIYYDHVLRGLGCDDAELHRALVTAIRRAGNWRHVPAGTRDTLLRLRKRFRLGVISNSDGTVRQVFEELGLSDCFDSFIDSGLVGYEKPDRRIFLAALESLGCSPEEALYVGDVYSIDYVGATRVGMNAVLMDVAGTYRDCDLTRVESLQDLERMLESDAVAASAPISPA
jgi:HAD superfamily hydrolase (TIGR01509 family)